MKASYREKRKYWHNINNFDTENGKAYGIDEIVLAGVEFPICNSKGEEKNILVVASASGDSSMHYEDNTPDGTGSLYGVKNQLFDNIIRSIMNEASDLTYNMKTYKHLKRPPEISLIRFFAVGRKEKFDKILTYNEVHCQEHPYYAFYIYIRQLIGEIRKIEIERLKSSLNPQKTSREISKKRK